MNDRKSSKTDPKTCDFCGLPASKTGPVIEGNVSQANPVHICADCVKTCQTILSQSDRHTALFASKVPTPRELVAHLDLYIIGQDQVKKQLAVAVSNHYKRLRSEEIRRLLLDVRPRRRRRAAHCPESRCPSTAAPSLAPSSPSPIRAGSSNSRGRLRRSALS